MKVFGGSTTFMCASSTRPNASGTRVATARCTSLPCDLRQHSYPEPEAATVCQVGLAGLQRKELAVQTTSRSPRKSSNSAVTYSPRGGWIVSVSFRSVVIDDDHEVLATRPTPL